MDSDGESDESQVKEIFSRFHIFGTRINRATQHRGIALITSLFFLVIMTLLTLSMFRSFNNQEKIAGNTREKQRSLQTAGSALQFGEWWLNQGNGTTGAICSTVQNVNISANVNVCSNALVNPGVLPWAARGDYLLPSMTVATGGGLVASGDINYLSPPSLYISYLGLDTTGKSMLYQVTAVGYGGSVSGASVVQSTYAMTPRTVALDQP